MVNPKLEVAFYTTGKTAMMDSEKTSCRATPSKTEVITGIIEARQIYASAQGLADISSRL